MRTKVDYDSLKREYTTTEISLRAMAKREGLSNSTLSVVARRQDADGKTWHDLKKTYLDEVERRFLRGSADSRARQLSRLADDAVNVLEAVITRLAIQLIGQTDKDGTVLVSPMEVPLKEGLEAIRQIQTLRGLPSDITEERKVVGHLVDPRLLDALGDLARRTLRPEPVDVAPPRALPGPVERSA
jgi:hypothetical protein